MKVLLFVVSAVCAHYASSLPVEVLPGKRQFGGSSRQQGVSTCGALLTNRNVLINDFNVVARLRTDIDRTFALQLFSSTAERSGLPLIKAKFASGPEMDLRRLRLHIAPGNCDDFQRNAIHKIAKTRHYIKGTTSAQMRFTLGDNVSAPDTPRGCCNLCAYVQPIIKNPEDGKRIHVLNEEFEQSVNHGKLFCRKGSKDDFLCDLPDICINLIQGTEGDDVLIGTPYNDHILGLGGNDRIIGGDGADYLNGGDGDDFIRGGPGSDLILGSAGSDNLKGGSGIDRLVGGEGDDYIGDSSKDSEAKRGPGQPLVPDNFAHGGNGDDTIVMGDGDDFLEGGAGNDTLSGGDGDDVIVGRGGKDTLRGGDGDDIVHADLGSSLILAYAGDGGDIFAGYPGPDDNSYYHVPDKVYGGNGNDSLIGDNMDLLDGGEGLYDSYHHSYYFDTE
ncbi:hypothetical protein NDN08_005317 [Rhodosorus marinus]|uniref:Calcium-binding protein n=1 Tax=Rhodosorus marinus TaxID=101924 RepID=A0AAV8V430_9RHOD|nr:hypothetical protein NDN08_005317 [Rhodosorus marinus]